VNITVQTYCGSIDFGIIACKVAVPDLNDLGTAIEGGYDELVALAQAKMALDKEREAAAIAHAASAEAPVVKATKTVKAAKATTAKPAAVKPSSKRSSTSR
jgi:diacylglycerol O-acyltransferase / wax synthase